MNKVIRSWRNYLMEQDLRAAMVVVLDEEQNVLMLKRTEDAGWMPNKWGLPGGHIEKGESSKDAAARETKEETNLSLNDLEQLVQRGQAMIYCSNSYTGDVEIDFEHTDWAWASYDELDNYDTTPGLKDTVRLALEKLSDNSV
jgi:8-oxo-dGTP pyrophosphatase MutT (NUDIX family)